MMEIQELRPYCYPTDIRVDYSELLESVKILLERLGLNLEDINEKCKNSLGYSINLTHLPRLKDKDRWEKYTDTHQEVIKQGVQQKNFTEHLEESQDLLIGKLVHKIHQYHSGKFQGRSSLTWLGSKQSYGFHRDYHTSHRYHVPIITNKDCFWLFKKDEHIYKLHMPADGRVWYFDPINIEHDFSNISEFTRLHLIVSTGRF